MLKFKNIWKGKINNIDHQEFDSNILTLSNYVDKVFSFSNDSTSEYQLVDSQEDKNNVFLVFKHNKSGLILRIMLSNLKNSGTQDKQDKRIQVTKAIPNFVEEEPYFALGFYNAGDKILISFGEISRFVSRAIKGKSFSSFWIPLDLLVETYNSKIENVSIEKKGGYVINCITLNKLKAEYHKSTFNLLVYNDKIKNQLKRSNRENVKIPIEPIVEPLGKGEYKLPDGVNITTITKLARDHNLRNKIIEKAKFKCEICGKKETFFDRKNKMYFEVHHLIPFHQQAQKHFKYSLDHESNLICLCPECHRKFHHSSKTRIKEMIISLFFKRKELLERYNIDTEEEVTSVVDFYLTSEGIDDE
jgi:5-methylcytosine-specific restriction protein A